MRHRLGLLGGLLALLAGVLVLMPPSQERQPALTVYSNEPAGGRALRLWLEALGYQVATLEDPTYKVPADATTLLVLQPTRGFRTPELDELERWVKGGGRLVVVGQGLPVGGLLRRFGLQLRALAAPIELAAPPPGAPLDPELRAPVVLAEEELLPPAGARPLLAAGDRLVGAWVAVERGQVWALSAPAALGNALLQQEDNARLALALVGPPTGRVAIDELHHGFGVGAPRPLTDLLLDRAWGQALLWGGLLTLAYLLLRGRRFGRSRPLDPRPGRSLAEYVTSLAGLYRASGKRAFVAEHVRARLRREACQALGLPGDVGEQELGERARALGRRAGPLLGVLAALGRSSPPGDDELLRLARRGERARIELSRAGPAGRSG